MSTHNVPPHRASEESAGGVATDDEAVDASIGMKSPDAEESPRPEDEAELEASSSRSRVSLALRYQVFWPSVGITLAFVVLAALWPKSVNDVIARISKVVVTNVGWYYILAVALFVVVGFALAFSRKGDTVLGPDDAEPEYSRTSWFSMLFAAGMGIGLVFWGAAEPLSHLGKPAPSSNAANATDRASEAMTKSFLHWGLHAWGIYVIVGLAIAYAVHRRGLPVSVRSTLRPIFGDRVNGKLGDVIAIIGTLVGIATSLGFGVKQVAAGFDFLAGWHIDNGMLILLVVVISGMAALSVASGLDAGIKFISNLNLVLAALLVVLVAILGPTVFLFNGFVTDSGSYFQNFISMSFETHPYAGAKGAEWLSQWTVYYWGWWISWSPFVGVFIARISKGRTVREFVLGVMLVPTLVTFVWFAILGGNDLYQQMFGAKNLIGPDGTVNVDIALFRVFEGMPIGGVLSILAMIVVIIFFVSSPDSGSYVMSMLSTGGNPNPPLATRLTFAALSGAIAAVMLGFGDSQEGMKALQTLSILTALPFSVVMVLMCWALWKQLAAEHAIRRRLRGEEFARAIVTDVSGTLRAEIFDELTTHSRRAKPRPIETTVDLHKFFTRLSRQARKREYESKVSEVLAAQTGTEQIPIAVEEDLPTSYDAINATDPDAPTYEDPSAGADEAPEQSSGGGRAEEQANGDGGSEERGESGSGHGASAGGEDKAPNEDASA